METYCDFKPFVDNPGFKKQREKALKKIDFGMIDAPILELIKDFAGLSYCFTLQCCYGHFVYAGQNDQNNIEPLPILENSTRVKYRIAYIALCIRNNEDGRTLLNDLKTIDSIDRDYIQFGCAGWFRKKQVNSYVLQVEPQRFKMQDTCFVNYIEALHIEKIKNLFFDKLKEIVNKK